MDTSIVSNKIAKINLNSVLIFPDEVLFREFDGLVLAISPITGNWLVLENNTSLLILKDLIAGKSVGDVARKLEDDYSREMFNSVLAQIFGRNFASLDCSPVPVGENDSRLSAYFYLTNACNLECVHCYMRSGKAQKGELSSEKWIALIDEFSRLGGVSITFTGGEVLAKKGWLSILRAAFDNKISSTVLTNGTLWSANDIYNASSLINEVQVSIDGPNESINSVTRGDGWFAKSLETALKFNELGVRTSVAMTPVIDNIDKFEDDLLDFYERYIDKTGINIRISQKLLKDRLGFSLSFDDQKLYQEKSKKLAHMLYKNSSARAFVISHPSNGVMKNCGLGGLTVSAMGDVYPCNRLDDVAKVGNVYTENLAEIFSRLNKIAEHSNVDYISPCSKCDLRYICGGGCRIDDYSCEGVNGVHSVKFFDHRSNSRLRKNLVDYRCQELMLEKMIEATKYIFL